MNLHGILLMALALAALSHVESAVAVPGVNISVTVTVFSGGYDVVLPLSTSTSSNSYTTDIVILNANGTVNSTVCSAVGTVYTSNVTLGPCAAVGSRNYSVRVYDNVKTTYVYATYTNTYAQLKALNLTWNQTVTIPLLFFNTSLVYRMQYNYTSEYTFDEIAWGNVSAATPTNIVVGSAQSEYRSLKEQYIQMCIPSSPAASTVSACALTDENGTAIFAAPVSSSGASSLLLPPAIYTPIGVDSAPVCTFQSFNSTTLVNTTRCLFSVSQGLLSTPSDQPLVLNTSSGTAWFGFKKYNGSTLLLMPNSTATVWIQPLNAWLNGGTRIRIDGYNLPSNVTVFVSEAANKRSSLAGLWEKSDEGTYEGLSPAPPGSTSTYIWQQLVTWSSSFPGTWNGTYEAVYFDRIELTFNNSQNVAIQFSIDSGVRISWLNIWVSYFWVWMPVSALYGGVCVITAIFFTLRHLFGLAGWV